MWLMNEASERAGRSVGAVALEGSLLQDSRLEGRKG